jgi:cobalt-precorrin-7 (C5)-methyltransferase
MKIVGVGCGPGLLTEQAIAAIAGATLLYGSDRAIGIARPHISSRCVVKTIDDYKALRELSGDFVILSTGDPMLAGLGYLDGEVIPGISSLQLAAARLRIPLARVIVVVAHGTGHETAIAETLSELNRKKIVFLLTDPRFDVDVLYDRIAGVPGPVRIGIFENLGYPEERIITGPAESRPRPLSDLYVMVIGNF